MPNVAAILRRKGTGVVTAHPDMTVLDAARIMNEHRIGCVVVTEASKPREITGILTERDILTRLVAAERDPVKTLVRDIMTKDVRCCTTATPTDELRGLMQTHRIRHFPVRDESGLCGLVSIGDVNAIEADGLTATIVAMEEYISRG